MDFTIGQILVIILWSIIIGGVCYKMGEANLLIDNAEKQIDLDIANEEDKLKAS